MTEQHRGVWAAAASGRQPYSSEGDTVVRLVALREVVVLWRADMDCSEIDAQLGAQHQRIFEMARAPSPIDGLEVRLDEEGTLAEVEAVGQFDNRLVIRDAPGGAKGCVAGIALR